MSAKRRRVLLVILSTVVLLAGLGVGFVSSISHELPEVEPSGDSGAADALAREIMAAVNADAWERTGAVSWVFRGEHEHLWDRERGLARVAWEADGEEVTAWLDLGSADPVSGYPRRFAVRRDGAELGDAAAEELSRTAWELWVNDSFWLNPLAKLFDPGTERAVVELPEEARTTDAGDAGESLRGLLVTYTSGGVTPGDSYLWIVGEDGRPVAWRMWTEAVPVGGLTVTWDDWQTLDTGAVVSGRHALPLGLELELTEIRGAASLDALVGAGEDPFAPLTR